MNSFLVDCNRTKTTLKCWPGPWPELVQAFKGGPVLIVGEGSSRLFPGGLAIHLARRFGTRHPVYSIGGREAALCPLSRWQILLVSNSGSTREPLEAVPTPSLALIGRGDGEMSRLGIPTRVVLDAPETAVAATVSVYAQALVLAEALCEANGRSVPMDRLIQGLEIKPDSLPQTRRFFWAGSHDGLAEELALKTVETAGLVGIACPGTMILHGLEEIWTEGDLVVDLGLSPTDARDLAIRAEGTGASVYRLPALAEDLWSGFDRLHAGWLLLADQARKNRRDPGTPSRARKVGNPIGVRSD